MLTAGILHLAAVLTLPAAPRLAMSAVVAPAWHGAGAAQWRQMQGITPRAYRCRRVDPANPVSLVDADVRSAGLHAQVYSRN